VHRVLEHAVSLEGAADHGVSEAIYLRDPDGNGVELYRDRPADEWPRGADGALRMHTAPLDLAGLLAEDPGQG
jgi:catechol 2,3-dioxygenase